CCRRSNLVPPRHSMRLAALCAAVMPVAAARAANSLYTGPSGLWSNSANWAAGAVPNKGDIVQLVDTGLGSFDVTFDETATGTAFNTILTDFASGGGVILFTQTANSLSTTMEQVGYDGVGVVNLMGGTHSVTGAG